MKFQIPRLMGFKVGIFRISPISLLSIATCTSGYLMLKVGGRMLNSMTELHTPV